MIGRAENRAHRQPPAPAPARRSTSLPAPDWAQVALVDTQPRSGNNSFPRGARPLAVIDHHPALKSTAAGWVDIRPGYGATATILAEYLQLSGLAVPPWLATALAYGISSETRDLGRGAGERDLEAYLRLYPKVRKRILARIEHPRLPRSLLRRPRPRPAPRGLAPQRHRHAARGGREPGQRRGDRGLPPRPRADGLVDRHRPPPRPAPRLAAGGLRGRGAGRLLREMLRERGTAGRARAHGGGQIDVAGLTPFEVEALEEELPARLLELLGFRGRAEFRPLLARAGAGRRGPPALP